MPEERGLAARVCVLVVASALFVACGDRDPRPSDVIEDLPEGLESTRDVDSTFGPGFAGTLKDAFGADDFAIGLVALPDSKGPCDRAVVVAFQRSTRVKQLDHLANLGAELASKDVNAFVPTNGIDGRLWPGDQQTCAEAVLAAEHDGLMVYAYGSAAAVARLVAHLPSVVD